MTKADRAALLRQRLAAKPSWHPWQPAAKKPRVQEAPRCKPFGPTTHGLLLHGSRESDWVKVPDSRQNKPVVGVKRTGSGAHPISKIAEIFEKARIESRSLSEVSSELGGMRAK